MAIPARITVTEFEETPGAVLRRVRRGQVIEITSRGQVVGRIEPVAAPPPAAAPPPVSVAPTEASSLRATLSEMWREHGVGVPEDPFDGVSMRAKGKARGVRW